MSVAKKSDSQIAYAKKKRNRLTENVLPKHLIEVMDCRDAFYKGIDLERKLERLIRRKKLEISEAVKKSQKKKTILRIFICSSYNPSNSASDFGEISVPSWVLKIYGKIIDVERRDQEIQNPPKFSTFFRSLVIELDREIYGPENHLFDWNRTANCEETDGFQISRHGNVDVPCKVYLTLNHEPPKYKIDHKLSQLIGLRGANTRASILSALWQHIKTFKLQDHNDRYYINCDSRMRKVFGVQRMAFDELSTRVMKLLTPADPIILSYVVKADPCVPESRSYYDVEVEVKNEEADRRMSTFLMNREYQRQLEEFDDNIHGMVEELSFARLGFEFFDGFAENPVKFMFKWLGSQSKDFETLSGCERNAENERHSDYYYQDWVPEAVGRYFFERVQKQVMEFDKNFGSK